MGKVNKKRKLSISEARKKLEKLKTKAPRAGVHHTKIVPDKTKYTRKKKHKAKDER